VLGIEDVGQLEDRTGGSIGTVADHHGIAAHAGRLGAQLREELRQVVDAQVRGLLGLEVGDVDVQPTGRWAAREHLDGLRRARRHRVRRRVDHQRGHGGSAPGEERDGE
jgi:hypothetical protein